MIDRATACPAQAIVITGGEPLLHVDSVVAFLDEARSLYPQVHTRIYTNGDRADEDALARLAATGLSEIRFSVKPPDDDDAQERALAAIGRAVSFVDDVVVEMPVIPGTGEWMIGLLREFDALGVRGVNLLEFCFPLHNAEQFVQRGFRLRRHPWNYLYDYWYSGGLPVAESERDALCLMQRAADEGLSFGLHYCSADNRNSAQVNRQNDAFFVQGSIRSTLGSTATMTMAFCAASRCLAKTCLRYVPGPRHAALPAMPMTPCQVYRFRVLSWMHCAWRIRTYG